MSGEERFANNGWIKVGDKYARSPTFPLKLEKSGLILQISSRSPFPNMRYEFNVGSYTGWGFNANKLKTLGMNTYVTYVNRSRLSNYVMSTNIGRN